MASAFDGRRPSRSWLTCIDTPQMYLAEVPAVNGLTGAQGLAGLYAVMANGGSSRGIQLLPPDQVQRMGFVQSASHVDRTLLIQTRFALGYWNSLDNRNKPGVNLSFLVGRNAIGDPGFGGSFGFADTQANLSMGYVMNRMGSGIALNPRGQSVVDAAYKVLLGYSSNKHGFWL